MAANYGEIIHDSELINSYVSINFYRPKAKAVDLADSVAILLNLAELGLRSTYYY